MSGSSLKHKHTYTTQSNNIITPNKCWHIIYINVYTFRSEWFCTCLDFVCIFGARREAWRMPHASPMVAKHTHTHIHSKRCEDRLAVFVHLYADSVKYAVAFRLWIHRFFMCMLNWFGISRNTQSSGQIGVKRYIVAFSKYVVCDARWVVKLARAAPRYFHNGIGVSGVGVVRWSFDGGEDVFCDHKNKNSIIG